MATPLVQTDLSAFWGLIHVTAKFPLPVQPVQDEVVPENPQGGDSFVNELPPSDRKEKSDKAEPYEEACPKDYSDSATPSQSDGASDRSFRLSSRTTQAVETRAKSNDASPCPIEPVAEEEERRESSATSIATGHSPLPSKVTTRKIIEQRRSSNSKAGSIYSQSGETLVAKPLLQEESAFIAFRNLCAAQGLLKRPKGLGKYDVPEGINDDATLRYALV